MSDLTAFEGLIKHLADAKYAFVCPSPETAGRVVEKRNSDPSTSNARNAQDFFGWNLACSRHTLKSIIPDEIFQALQNASIIVSDDSKCQYRSTIRVSNFYLPNIQRLHSTTAQLYYIHSSFPASSDSVFFGPDTYLFTQFLQTAQHHLPNDVRRAIDVCCGSGAGAIHVARAYPRARILGLDLNPHALRLGEVNARLADAKIDFHESDLYAAVSDEVKKFGIDLIVSNPPYIASSADGKDLPMYADGGAEFGLDISLKIVEDGIGLLSEKGIIIVYTGVAIASTEPGHDTFLEKLQAVKGAELTEYTILNPDMWSEEIGQGAYADVGRIQVVGAVLRKC